MAGYPPGNVYGGYGTSGGQPYPPPSGAPTGAPPPSGSQPYPPPSGSQSYPPPSGQCPAPTAAPPPSGGQSYQPHAPTGAPPQSGGQPCPPSSAPYVAPQPYGGASPFVPPPSTSFPSGTDPSIVAYFQMADQDKSGLIDDKELQKILAFYNGKDGPFSLKTVHLLMYVFTNSNSRTIGPKEFISVYYCLQYWKEIFDRFDKDKSGQIDSLSELREAILCLNFTVLPVVLDLLISKFEKDGGGKCAITYDNFVECSLIVKGLTDKFKEYDPNLTGSATLTYETFMLIVLPFLIA